ncbi:MAG TPA: AAA family ATPase, partial [Candidatus Tectomicrobia bacterium]
MLYSFADCELDTERALLRRAGQPIELQRRVFKLLTYLLEHAGHIVSRDELAEQVWQAAIANATVDACIKEVRQAVGDNGRDQRIIATRHGFGYEFVAAVVARPREPVEAAPPVLLPPVPMPAPLPVAEAQNAAPSTASLSQTAVLPEVYTGEKKIVTILCCGIQIHPPPPVGADLDHLFRQMRALYRLIRQAVEQYGGTIQPITGNRFLAVFGAPMAQEDHAQRAVSAALGLRHQLSTPAPPMPPAESLAVRLGLHTGEVTVGGFAEDQALAAVVGGETALLATALQDAAEPGTMLCSAATVRLVQGMVDVEPVEPMVLAGQSLPGPVYQVLQPQTPQTAGALRRIRPLRRFVGRRQELATLRQRLEQVEAGHGQVVGIAGELGIGKSRLRNEFRQRLTERPITYLEGRCLSYGQETPYRPILEILRHACGLTELDSAATVERHVIEYLQKLGMVPEDSAPYLLHLLGVPAGTERLQALPPQELKARIYATFRRLVGHASQQRPLVLVIEDLHWIDATSEALLTTLVEHIAGVPVLLLATYRHGYRPPWLDKSYATQLTVQPLTPRDSRHLVQEVFSSVAVPESLVQRLLEQAEGNPFFLEELAWTVMEHGASSPSVEVPDTVQATLMARIDRLPPVEKHLLQVAAVIGKDVPLALLESVAELPAETLQAGLDRLQGAEFLYESRLLPAPVYTFKHALTQEVAYQSLLRSTRQPYHQRIAQTLAEQSPETVRLYPERLARHYTEAGLGEQAIPYWQQAGQRALERSANHEAVSHFTKGLELLQSLPVTPEHTRQELALQLALGPPLRMIKGHTAPEVEDVYTRTYELSQQVGDSRQQFSALMNLWRWYHNRARIQKARELAEQCFTLAHAVQDPGLLQDAHRMLGWTAFFHGEPVLARTHFEQGIALYDAQQGRLRAFSGGMDHGVTCLSVLAGTLWQLGYPEQALTKNREALTLAQESSHTFSLGLALQYCALVHQSRRDAQHAQEIAEATIQLAREHGFVQWIAGGMCMRGWALAEQGSIEEGIEQLRQGMATWQTVGTELGQTHMLFRLAEAYGKGGQAEEGLRLLDEALTVMHERDERHTETEIYRLRGELLLAQGGGRLEAVEAEKCFHQALALARQRQAKSFELRAAMSLCRLWQQQGKLPAAQQLLAEIYAWFTEGFTTPDLQ